MKNKKNKGKVSKLEGVLAAMKKSKMDLKNPADIKAKKTINKIKKERQIEKKSIESEIPEEMKKDSFEKAEQIVKKPEKKQENKIIK